MNSDLWELVDGDVSVCEECGGSVDEWFQWEDDEEAIVEVTLFVCRTCGEEWYG